MTLGEKFAKDGSMSAFSGIWLAVFIFIPFEIYLFYKASTDSVIINYDYYVEMVTKFIRKITPEFIKRQRFRRRRRRNQRKIN